MRIVRSIGAARLPRSFMLAGAFSVVAGVGARAQGHDMAGMDHHRTAAPSSIARRQIDSVVKATLPLGSHSAATRSGFQPAFGWIPTMGEHWVARGLMMNGRQTNRATPSQLMFSRIDGRDSLVGAAYAYMTAVGDTVRPRLFDGAPPWHEHRDLAPEGMTLVMLHVWFVPSPDGPFAGTNPNLPFWALGLAAPDASRMRDPVFSMRVRRAALALGAVADSTSILSDLEQRRGIADAIDARRDTVSALVPRIRAAQRANDRARWDAVVEQAARQWDGMYATYLSAARTADGKARITQYVDLLLGRHED